jgi:hypothetical protein
MSRISAITRAAVAACLIIGACSAAIADDYRVESYKNSVVRIVEIWSAKLADLGRQLAPINDELSKLQQVQSPGPDETRRIAELEQKREDIRKQVDQAGLELNLNLILIEPLVGAPKRELVVLPDWMKQIIKDKGIPLGNGASIAPDVDFDFKAMKLKSVSIIVHW